MTIIEKEGYHHKRVVLLEDYAGFKKGLTGLCTADLEDQDGPGQDIFAVWFDQPISYTDGGKPLFWVTFKGKGERNKFEIIE